MIDLLCSNICCLCCSTFRFTTQRSKFHCQFHFLDLEFVRFLGCFFCWFWPKKKFFFGGTGFFCDIGGFFGFLMIQFWLILEKNVLFLLEIFRKKFHFLDLEFVRFSAAFCCSAISFFGGTGFLVILVQILDSLLDFR